MRSTSRWAAVAFLALGSSAAAIKATGAQTLPPNQGKPSAGPQAAQIDRNGALTLIRSTILAVHQANETGNYTVLRDLGAPGFQAANSAARLGEVFVNLRTQKVDLSGVSVLEPQLTVLPQIEGNGGMRMAGFFPSVPFQVNFDLLFMPVAGRWRHFAISIGIGQTTPTAPQPESTAPPPTTPDPKEKLPNPSTRSSQPPTSKAPAAGKQ